MDTHTHSSVTDSYINIFPCRRRRVFTLTTLCYCAISSAVARRLCLSHKSQFCQTAGRIEPVFGQGQSIISCSPSRRRRQAGPRNKPWAPEWRIVYIYEQVCIYLRRLEYESISLFDFVMDSQYSNLRVNLLSKPLLSFLRQLM